MQWIDGRFIYSASDLNDYLQCRRLAELDVLVARGQLHEPDGDDEQADLIRRKGEEHEARYLDRVRERHGDEVVVFARPERGLEGFAAAERQTLEAMRAGVPVIYQATFFDGRFLGHADFLYRVETPSQLGAWSYEVLDTKLALNPKPYFLVQLCNYSEHLQRLQGTIPQFGSIVLGDLTEKRYRLLDYLAYYRHLKASFLQFATDPARTATGDAAAYPHRVEHCRSCPWDDACTKKREADDHLSLVAWMRRDQIEKFEAAGIATVAALAAAADGARPATMGEETFVKLRRQARLQVRGRDRDSPIYELLRHAPPLGFAQMPAPAPGDVFFDMEGDPLFEPGRGLEYLFGCWLPDDEPKFKAFWGCNRTEEKRAFEAFVDFVVERRRRYPALHVYHYASYEKAALRKLAQSHCTREEEVDDLLRGEVLVDLYAVVRQALAISEDGYGLKKIEKFYRLIRGTDVKKGDESIVMFERWLQQPDPKILDDLAAYNRDDCESTWRLRDWLLERRDEAIAKLGLDLPLRPVKLPDEPCHAEFLDGCRSCATRRSEQREDERRTQLERALLAGVPLVPQSEADYRAMPEDRRSRFLLGNALAYHRREEKPAWWQYFDRCENIDGLVYFDREAIGDLKLDENIAPFKLGPRDRNLVYTYTFPDQHHKLAGGDEAHDPRTRKACMLVGLDEEGERNFLQLKVGGGLEYARAIPALIPRGPYNTAVQRAALARVAEAYLAGRLQSERPASFDLLSARDPRVTGLMPGGVIQPHPVTADAISSIVQSLDRSYLFIQGPPGSGKTTKGAHVICDLLQLGKRVAVTSTGHKAIHNLLHKVEAEMHERKAAFRGLYKCSDGNDGSDYVSRLERPFVTSTSTNFGAEGCDLAGGTSYLFARDELEGKFDYLFIDEAGQVSLADALAVSTCARNVVLLGDPAQLAQVGQGIHPLHVADSILQHLLGDAATVPPNRGVFLDESYRMQPEICKYVSAMSYEGRLEAEAQTRLHGVTADGVSRAGLEYLPVEHAGNASSSIEEADAIVREVALLLRGQVTDSRPPELCGKPRPMRERDIMIVTPYNAQRRLITSKLKAAGISVEPGAGVEVGTVDKFQGREAAVVFYSMATSSGEDAPRDMTFLFEQNRFNVAISRARALSVLVCSPRLLETACRTPEQMALVNLLCEFAERASRPRAGERHGDRHRAAIA